MTFMLPKDAKCAKRRARRFLKQEDGAVTVDWVVITGVICGLGVAVATLILSYIAPNSDNIGQAIEDYEISTTFD